MAAIITSNMITGISNITVVNTIVTPERDHIGPLGLQVLNNSIMHKDMENSMKQGEHIQENILMTTEKVTQIKTGKGLDIVRIEAQTPDLDLGINLSSSHNKENNNHMLQRQVR